MIGSKYIEIPSHKYRSCQGCDFYERTMFKSGRNPEYNHNCKHAHALKLLHGNLDSDATPDWCPVMLKNVRACGNDDCESCGKNKITTPPK